MAVWFIVLCTSKGLSRPFILRFAPALRDCLRLNGMLLPQRVVSAESGAVRFPGLRSPLAPFDLGYRIPARWA